MERTTASVVSYLWKILFTVQFHVTFWHDVLCFFRLESIFVYNQEAFLIMIKSQSNVNMRKTRNFHCVVFVILFLEWIRIKTPLNLSGNDCIKEKRFATFKFEVCAKGQEISEENIVPLFFYLTYFRHLGQKSGKFGVFEDTTIFF